MSLTGVVYRSRVDTMMNPPAAEGFARACHTQTVAYTPYICHPPPSGRRGADEPFELADGGQTDPVRQPERRGAGNSDTVRQPLRRANKWPNRWVRARR